MGVPSGQLMLPDKSGAVTGLPSLNTGCGMATDGRHWSAITQYWLRNGHGWSWWHVLCYIKVSFFHGFWKFVLNVFHFFMTCLYIAWIMILSVQVSQAFKYIRWMPGPMATSKSFSTSVLFVLLFNKLSSLCFARVKFDLVRNLAFSSSIRASPSDML